MFTDIFLYLSIYLSCKRLINMLVVHSSLKTKDVTVAADWLIRTMCHYSTQHIARSNQCALINMFCNNLISLLAVVIVESRNLLEDDNKTTTTGGNDFVSHSYEMFCIWFSGDTFTPLTYLYAY